MVLCEWHSGKQAEILSLRSSIDSIRKIARGGKLYARDVDALMEHLDWIIEACEEVRGETDVEGVAGIRRTQGNQGG